MSWGRTPQGACRAPAPGTPDQTRAAGLAVLPGAPWADALREHTAVLRRLAGLQSRVQVLVDTHQAQVTALEGEIVRLRGQVIRLQSVLALAGKTCPPDGSQDEAQALQPHARAADWVICQTGCLPHDQPWREDDQCRRTGAACVLAGPEAGDLPQPSGKLMKSA